MAMYEIKSAEQLENLPDKSIVVGSHGIAYQKLQDVDAPIGLSWNSVFGTSATPQGLLEHHAPLKLVHIPQYPGEDGTATSGPDYLHTQRTIANVIHYSPHPLMLTEIHDLAYQITDALVKACIIPTPRPKDDAGDEGRYSKRDGIRRKAMVTAEKTLYAALGPDHDTYALARHLIAELEAEGCLATTKES